MLVLILAAMRFILPGERQLWVHLVVAALLANALPYTLFGVAEQTVDSNLAGAINATTPLWTVHFAQLARRHDPLALVLTLVALTRRTSPRSPSRQAPSSPRRDGDRSEPQALCPAPG